MTDLAVRSRQEEQMDADDLAPEIYDRVLADLSRVNRLTFTAQPTLGYLARATKGVGAFSLMDVGFGQGDLLRDVARWARKCGKQVTLVGVDLNPKSAGSAAAATPPGMRIDYRTGNYADQGETFDFIISSQTAHHMTDAQLLAFLRFMEDRAARGWLVNDLHRHGFSHWGFPILARLMGVHRIVREDGQLSIARSFRPNEWRDIVTEAGIDPPLVKIARRFPFRLCVERIR